MFTDTLQKSVLEWLQLTPELLSGLPGRGVVRKKPSDAPMPPPVSVSAPSKAELPAAVDMHAGLISAQSVLGTGAAMAFVPASERRAAQTAAPAEEPWQQLMRLAYPEAGRAYAAPGLGGNTGVALAEMTSYLATGLQPAATKLGN